MLEDPDAIVRAAVVESLPVLSTAQTNAALADASSLVRHAALTCLLACQPDGDLDAAIGICLQTRWSDGLTRACESSERALSVVMALLASPGAQPAQKLVALEALGAMQPRTLTT